MQNLQTLTKTELETFVNSFDQILCDVHGVLWDIFDSIPGAPEAVALLKKLNKRFIIVSNNTTATVDDYQKKFISAGFDVKKEDIVTPIVTTVAYLKKQNVTKDVFVLGTASLRNSIQEAGFKLAERGPMEIEETIYALGLAATVDDGTVGAVVVDCDINYNYVNLQKAVNFLKRPEVVFVQGAGDMKFPIGLDRVIMGPGVFHKILIETTGRKPVTVAKPGYFMNEYIVNKYQISDPKRVLFIGDSIPSDMEFAHEFGYQKLLISAWGIKDEEVKEWESLNGGYYITDLKSLHNLLLQIA